MPKQFELGILVGGEQGNPDFEVMLIRTIEAETVDEAREKWKEATGQDDNGLVAILSLTKLSERKHVVLSFRQKESTDVIGSFGNEKLAMEAAVKDLKTMNVDEKWIQDELGPDWTWGEAVEKWSDLTDGYEEYTLQEVNHVD